MDKNKSTKTMPQKDSVEKEETQEQKRIIELTNDLKRVQAEFENFQKRVEKQNCDFKEYVLAQTIEELLPVLDSLELGLKHNKDFVQIYEQLFLILRKNGLSKIEVNVGDNFDHEIMDCLMQESNNNLKEGQVVQVLSTGYKLKNKVLRTTKISINNLLNQKNDFDEKELKKNDFNYENKDSVNNKIEEIEKNKENKKSKNEINEKEDENNINKINDDKKEEFNENNINKINNDGIEKKFGENEV